MYNIVHRLLEGRSTIYSNKIFDINMHTEGSKDFMQKITQNVVEKSVRYLFDDTDIQIEHERLKIAGTSTGDRELHYKVDIYHSSNDSEHEPLSRSEENELTSLILSDLVVPDSDSDYDYNLEVDYNASTLSIEFIRIWR